jgi:hypothetical protein
MSAYDMKFSDEIYGVAADQRYVSKSRVESMLEHEFDLIVSRISEQRPDDSRFFAFANTVAAQGYKKRADCHGWLGIRLQLTPQAPPDEIILHVRMLDDSNIDQQEALGILGVNLIYGAYHYSDNPERLLKSLVENLRWGRIEIDLIEMRGPTLGPIDDRLMALELVKEELTSAVLFDLAGKVVIPSDTFYRKQVLAMRGKFYAVEQGDIDLFMHAKARFQKESEASNSEILSLTELTMAQMANDTSIDTSDFLARADRLSEAGFHVLISGFFRHFRVVQYLAGNTREPVAIATDVEGFRDIFREDYYDGLVGGILEGLGQTFPRSTVLYVYPTASDNSIASYEDLPVEDHLKPLLSYLHDRNQIVFVDDYKSLPG